MWQDRRGRDHMVVRCKTKITFFLKGNCYLKITFYMEGKEMHKTIYQ
jgi:hypothetical protein